ncbi:MAG TPA: hypothetical protein PKE19_03745 [Aestuariivirga sp.]|nr:hypothetical protein [Aestuariivirga sp.]
MKTIRFGTRRIRLPHHPMVRMALGLVLVLGGFFGFLPVLGFWMVPLGLVILSVDLARVRRFRRRFAVWVGHSLAPRHPRLARALGYGRRRRRAGE